MGKLGEDAGMDPHTSFAEVDRKLRAGDQDAATEVFCRFAEKLIGLAHSKLDIRILCKEDPTDVVQSVFRSFFTRHRDGEYELATWDKLWSLLTVISVRKCLNRTQYYMAKRRDIAREVPAAEWNDAAAGLSDAINRNPTLLEAAVLFETVEQMTRGLDADDWAIIELRLQGLTAQQISEKLGLSERTVRRVRERIVKRLQRMQADDSHAA
jgi:RNA polymerase sigma-70 factor, ECF subfamily